MLLAARPEEEWTEDDLESMSAALQEYGDDPEFAERVIDSMGMEAYLRLSQQLEHAVNTDLAGADVTATQLREGMGTTLNTAMQPPYTMSTHPPGSPAFEAWLRTPEGRDYQDRLDALHRVGGERWVIGTTNGDSRLGYDVVLDLLEQSGETVDDQFYNQLLSGMIDAEQRHMGIWNADRYPGEEGRDPRNDAVDRLLGFGAENNPDAVTAFFDPNGNGTGDNHVEPSMDTLHYFIGEGADTRKVFLGDHTWLDVPTMAGESPGLAAALGTAATGIPASGPPDPDFQGHSDANIAIAEEVWNTFADKPHRATEAQPTSPPCSA